MLTDETSQLASSSGPHGMMFFFLAKGPSKFRRCRFVLISALVGTLRNLLGALWYLRTAAEDPTRLYRIPYRLHAHDSGTPLFNVDNKSQLRLTLFQWISHNISYWSHWPFSRKQETHRTGNVRQQTVFFKWMMFSLCAKQFCLSTVASLFQFH